MTPAEQIAWHRSEADRIEAEERARRPALAAGQVWEREGKRVLIAQSWVRSDLFDALSMDTFITQGTSIAGLPDGFAFVGLARDVLRVVPPEPPAPQVAPEPTGAELVGVKCWVTAELGGSWLGPVEIVEFDRSPIPYRATQRIDGSHWFYNAKPCVEGVAP